MTIQMLDPVQEPLDVSFALAPRLATLTGKTLGLYSNNKLNSVRLMDMIADDLARDHDFAVRRGSYHASVRMEPGQWGDVDTCDAVILANGDCGACSSSGIANAIDLEKRGIPTLLITTPPFLDAIRTMAAINGIGSMACAVVDHPIGSVTEPELMARATAAARQFRQIILLPAQGIGTHQPAAADAGA